MTAARSLGKEELLRPRVPGAAQRPVVTERGRHVAELGAGHDHALDHGGEPHRADLEAVLGPDAIELLTELDLLVGPHGARRVDDLDDALHLRRRFGAVLSAGCVPAAPQRTDG